MHSTTKQGIQARPTRIVQTSTRIQRGSSSTPSLQEQSDLISHIRDNCSMISEGSASADLSVSTKSWQSTTSFAACHPEVCPLCSIPGTEQCLRQAPRRTLMPRGSELFPQRGSLKSQVLIRTRTHGQHLLQFLILCKSVQKDGIKCSGQS